MITIIIQVDIMFCEILFKEEEDYLKDIIHKEMHKKLGVKQDGYMFSPAYKSGFWDGITDFYNKDSETFPTGLLPQVDKILGELQNNVGFTYSIEDIRPDKFLKSEDIDKEIKVLKDGEEVTLRDYQRESVVSIIQNQLGIINASTNSGKSLTASGLIQQILPYLESDERIAFFTHSKSIFTQNAKAIGESLGIEVGMYGSGKKDIRKVTFVMIPTMVSAITKDPESGIKLTAKERRCKKIAKEIAPKFTKGFNQRSFFFNYIKNFKPSTKTGKVLKDELEDILDTCGTDKQLVMKLKGYEAQYQKILEKKNGKVLKKKQEAQEFLDSIAVMIVDEAHHTSSDSWYKVLTSCPNAQYRMALTGSIDKKNKLLWQRMKALFGEVTMKVSNEQMIKRGISAKPTITMFPILAPTDIQNKDYMTAYELGIAENEYRNLLIAKLVEKMYNRGKGILVIVSRIEHGEHIDELLDQLEVPHEFIYGDTEDDQREARIQSMREGGLKVLISSTILDEGVDISGINTLIMGAGGKSLRQTLQRVGRGLRKKQIGENTLDVFDFSDYSNKYLKRHSEERMRIYENEGFEVKEIPLPK